MDGIKYRRKLRLRTYKDGDKSLGFVEIKQRINRTVQKRRIVLPYEKALALCGGTDIETAELDALDQQTASEVLFLVKSMLQKPQCIISYHRKAYEGSRFDHGLRVTFDTHLKYRLHDLNLHSKSEDRFFLPPDTIVMEVKANEKIPLWLSSMLSAHQCGLERVSKYCLGMSTGLRHRENSRITY